MAYTLAVRRARVVVVQRGVWKVEDQAVKRVELMVDRMVGHLAVGLGYDGVGQRVAAMADRWVDRMVGEMVGQWAVGLGYPEVEEKDKQTVAQRIEQWVEMMDVNPVDLKDVSMVAS
jgi:hypothetical protein